ncbi:MAG TPA: restriction endonuclease [Gammaproteobacteria bacterium]|nr:restriction endonuclease [Gammaproteobacteria bacterium]
MTIIEVIKETIRLANRPLSVNQIFESIVKNNLYEFNTKYPKGVVNSQLRRHCRGIDFPSANPVKHFKIIGKNKYDILVAGEKNGPSVKDVKGDTRVQIPEEILEQTYKDYKQQIKQELLTTIVKSDPAFFEQLVIDLLLKMGYGENGSGNRRGKVGDGGIDGEILQDKLGLDRIYIQAKRHSEKTIGSPVIQQFVGALQNITKGVFITTSSFSRAASRYAEEQQQKTLVLIDGDKLTDLMVDYGLGISEVATYTVFKVDSGYFSEG